MNSIDDLTREEFNILDFFAPAVARWKAVLLISLICAALGFGIKKTCPRQYESNAVIFVQQSSKAGIALKDLPIPFTSGGGGSSDYIITLLRSDAMLSSVLTRLKLAENPAFTEDKKLSIEDQLAQLRSWVNPKDSKGTITISVRAPKPGMAAGIANCMLDNLGSFMVTSSKRKANFISDRIDETAASLAEAEDQLRKFQEKNDVTLIEEDAKNKIQELAQLDSKLLTLDSQLQQMDSELANAGELNSLVDKEVRKKSIQSSRDYVLQRREDFRRQLGRMPAVAMEYARIERRISVLSKTYELLTQQYQLARITQQGEDGDYQIVDRASPKYKPLASGATTNGAVFGMVGFMLASIMASITKRTRKRVPATRSTSRQKVNV